MRSPPSATPTAATTNASRACSAASIPPSALTIAPSPSCSASALAPSPNRNWRLPLRWPMSPSRRPLFHRPLFPNWLRSVPVPHLLRTGIIERVSFCRVPFSMRILLTTFGSYGDLYPYLSLGGELRRRGHQVTLATSAVYRPKVESAGLSFHPVRPDVSLDDRQLLAYVMDAKRGSERIVRYLASSVRDSYDDVYDVAAGADLVLTHP